MTEAEQMITGPLWADVDTEPEEEQSETEKQKEEKEEEEKLKYALCKFYTSFSGCYNGDSCKFEHPNICKNFNSQRGCPRTSTCKFTHVISRNPKHILRQCPNFNCGNMCVGRQCEPCHKKYQSYKTGIPHQCPTCPNLCKGKRCRECHFKASRKTQRTKYACDDDY